MSLSSNSRTTFLLIYFKVDFCMFAQLLVIIKDEFFHCNNVSLLLFLTLTQKDIPLLSINIIRLKLTPRHLQINPARPRIPLALRHLLPLQPLPRLILLLLALRKQLILGLLPQVLLIDQIKPLFLSGFKVDFGGNGVFCVLPGENVAVHVD